MPTLTRELQIALQVALAEAARRRHEYAGVEHLLYALLHDEETAEVVQHAGGDVEALKKRLDRFLADDVDILPEDAAAEPQPTMGFRRAVQRAALHVQGSGKQMVAGFNVLVAIYAEQDSHAAFFLEQAGVTRLDVINYVSHGISKDGDGEEEPVSAGDDGEAEEGGAPKRDPLASFCVDLNAQAAAGAIDPLIGRDAEVERAVQVLCRRRKNNPLFVGDSGVGKTALAEGLALRIVRGEVPAVLAGATIYSLDLGGMLAGTRYRGDFESRVKSVLKALEGKPGAILFIDEIHNLVGAGAASGGAMDAGNLLKPALASGKLRCIGSTTFEEFRNHLQRDRALTRRFQTIEVAEPSQDDSVRILAGLKSHYEEFHGVRYTRPALRAAVDLSARYIRDRHLPDKAIDVIDEAGARLKLLPGPRRKTVVGVGEVEAVVAAMARMPPKRVSTSDRDRLRTLEEDLGRKVFGQREAVRQVASSIKLARAGLRDKDKPIACFLFTGPTGVGKTELAKQLAAHLDIGFLRFDMSEYMERHTVSRLIGAPPGYVGFDQGGLLTEAMTRTPHAVLLLDEVEKAHPEVFNILLQVMDHGTLTDNNGKKADFRHAILIMTSNVGARDLVRSTLGFGAKPDFAGEDKAFRDTFSPEFRNRLDARVRFDPLDPSVMESIVQKFVDELQGALLERRVTIELAPEARAWLAEKGYDPTMGARPLARLIQEQVKKPLSEELLFGQLEKGGHVRIAVKDGALAFEYGPKGPTVVLEKDGDEGQD
ncbi:ATP-dependent Clp protease ATP-binding subunit ClpA [Myxococcota bacterium]|nr:ATP-dependent Clp protease ATP-binding subunit ClpA [Myxococcota bacterium]